MLSTMGSTGTATLERVAVEEPPPWVVGELEATTLRLVVGSSRVDLQACKLEYSIVSPK